MIEILERIAVALERIADQGEQVEISGTESPTLVWFKHDGGEKPTGLPDRVLVELRSGNIISMTGPYQWNWKDDSGDWENIMRYRISNPQDGMTQGGN